MNTKDPWQSLKDVEESAHMNVRTEQPGLPADIAPYMEEELLEVESKLNRKRKTKMKERECTEKSGGREQSQAISESKLPFF